MECGISGCEEVATEYIELKRTAWSIEHRYYCQKHIEEERVLLGAS